MKQLLFLFVVLSSFSMPPVLVDDKKNDWVYELSKPVVAKKLFTGITLVYCYYTTPCNGIVSAYVVASQSVPYNRLFALSIAYNYGGTIVYNQDILTMPANITDSYIFVYGGSGYCQPIVSSSAGWYNPQW